MLKVKTRPSSYHTTICHIRSRSFQVVQRGGIPNPQCSTVKTCTDPLLIQIKNGVISVVESVTLNNADSTAAVLSSSDKLLKYNRGENLNLNTNACVCTKKKNIYSVCTYSMNLQITSRLKTVICSSLCLLTSLRWVHVKSIQMWHSEMASCARFCTAKEASLLTSDRRARPSILSR